MKLLFNAVLILLSISSFSQIPFDKGYFIDNNGLRTECLVNNPDGEDNPVNFEFKLAADESPKTMSISLVREFGVYNISRFVRADVKIDRSKTKVKELTSDPQPDWSAEQLFLKVLFDGNAILYYFHDQKNLRFFYSIDNSPIEQLISKQYKADRGIMNNNKYKEQLGVNIKCPNLTDAYSLTEVFSQSELESYFRQYYKCTNNPYIEYDRISDKFIKGYYIDNNGLKIECLIKNQIMAYNPVNFEIKLQGDNTPNTIDPSSVKEFGIYNISRFVSADVKIDRSRMKYNELTRIKEPEWSEERLFLRVLIEGKATLYYFQDFNNTRFFYSTDNSPVEQLIYKIYLDADDKERENNKFRQQLWAHLQCVGMSQKSVEALRYRQNEIEDHYKKYYECTGYPYVTYNNK